MPAKLTRRGYRPPSWFKSLPAFSYDHGSTRSQKKAWRVVSEYVRKRDWEKYKTCISCGTYLESWQKGQAGHWIPWSVCHGMFKYDLRNLAMQCAGCNGWGGGNIGHAFGEKLKERYGDSILDDLIRENQSHRGQKIEEFAIVEMCAKLLNRAVD